MPLPLPDDLSLGRVGLAVRDLDRSLVFYGDRLGLGTLEREPGRAVLGAGPSPLLELVERRGGERDGTEAGLFHVALRVPDRAALAGILRRLLAADVPLTGASDHIVSEALYLDDPDGHGLEIYADRPRDGWFQDGKLRLATLPLDGPDLLAAAEGPAALPSATVVGHVHLETHDLAAARGFYVDGLGLEVMATVPQALFLARARYHHHLAVNRWNRRQRPAEDRLDRIGILYYTLLADRTERLTDPSGLEVRIEPAGGPAPR
jgi:catechol 2,3-dioxygenase